jgi:acyl-CoA thioester hydrolase
MILDPVLATSTLHIRVRFCETDLMGIVHHANYLAYCEAGRVEWLRRRGVTYSEWAARGIHLPVVEASLRYRAPARFDDVIDVETRLADVRAVSLRYEYRITRDAKLLATGMTRLACIDATHMLQRIPDEVMGVLGVGEIASAERDRIA